MVSTGSTTSHNSSHKEGSQASVQQKTRKQMIIEKLREQLFKAKAFVIKRYDEASEWLRVYFGVGLTPPTAAHEPRARGQ